MTLFSDFDKRIFIYAMKLLPRYRYYFTSFLILLIANSCKLKDDYRQKGSVTFAKDIQPIISANCTNRGCHLGTEQVSLITYEDVIRNGYVVDGNPRDNVLYQAISDSNADERMPPAPFPPLKPEQLKLIHEWIYQGAQK